MNVLILLVAVSVPDPDNAGWAGGAAEPRPKAAEAPKVVGPKAVDPFAKTPLSSRFRFATDPQDRDGEGGASSAPPSGLRPRRVLPDAEGNYSYTTSKGVAIERRVDENGNVQIDFPGGDPAKFSEPKDFASPTVYERAKARLQAASALAPTSLGGPAPAMAAPAPAQYAPAYAPPAPVQAAPASSWQPLASSPGYEAWGTVGPDGVWRYEPGSVRPMAGWAAQAQVQPVVSYSAPAMSYAPPAYYSAPASSPCGPYGCSVSGGPVGGFGPRGGLLGFGVLGRR
jgi:hypothetical protein